jgi:hypothetical protein
VADKTRSPAVYFQPSGLTDGADDQALGTGVDQPAAKAQDGRVGAHRQTGGERRVAADQLGDNLRFSLVETKSPLPLASGRRLLRVTSDQRRRGPRVLRGQHSRSRFAIAVDLGGWKSLEDLIEHF